MSGISGEEGVKVRRVGREGVKVIKDEKCGLLAGTLRGIQFLREKWKGKIKTKLS